MGDKIADAFKNFRKNKGGKGNNGGKDQKPSWGKNNDNNQKPSWGKNNDNNQKPSWGCRRLQGDDFMNYLKQHGFTGNVDDVKKKMSQDMKDKADGLRASRVLTKFDRDNNHKVSLCEFEQAMYRTQMLEKRMQMGNGKKDYVVVHG